MISNVISLIVPVPTKTAHSGVPATSFLLRLRANRGTLIGSEWARSSKEDLRRTSLPGVLTLPAEQQGRFAGTAETWAG